MQFSMAQRAADQFIKFLDGQSNPEDVVLLLQEASKSAGDKANDLRYISDELHLWLLTGGAHVNTMNDYTLYMQTVAIVFAEFVDMPGSFQGRVAREALFPPPFVPSEEHPEREDEQYISAASYAIPLAISPEFYRFTATLDRATRVALIVPFLSDPATHRVQF
ncbi:MAG: hypothetical protein JWO99_480 [Candidatus Saccharibacteria bacterium]|nr:hypothetical protein [Candidatus Saccharibacteria bacterium]